jgi:lauroyl/myristoyl acyltransferase
VTDLPTADGDERLTLGQHVSWRLYTSMERIAMTWPERSARALFAFYGAMAFRFLPKLRTTVARNYAQVLGRAPESPLVQAAVRDGFSLYARYWYETFAVRTWDRDRINRSFIVEGLENLDKALAAGRGCIVALPHMGNWDVAGRFLAVNDYKMVAVAEQLKPRQMYELFLRHRRDLGMEIVPLTEDRSAGLRLAQMLADNYVVALVADRDLGGKGVPCDMFGGIRRLPSGPARLSLATGAPLLSCHTHTTDTGWQCRIGEPLEVDRTGEMRRDVTAMTRLMAADWERAIAAHPTDWHMFQPAWDFSEPQTALDPTP